jgi:antitoxin MazE
MDTTTQLSKWGHSLAVRIPRSVVQSAGLREGDRLKVGAADDGSVVIRPVRRKHSLEELVSRITPKNRHSETSWGKPSGREIW